MKYLSLIVVALIAVTMLSISFGQGRQSIFADTAGPDLPVTQDAF